MSLPNVTNSVFIVCVGVCVCVLTANVFFHLYQFTLLCVTIITLITGNKQNLSGTRFAAAFCDKNKFNNITEVVCMKKVRKIVTKTAWCFSLK